MSRLRTNALRHVDGTSDNITFDSSTNVTVAGNLTLSGTGNQSIAGNLQFNSGYGSAATAYGVRAWINFDGTAATIGTGRGSGNMDAVTDNGTGDYTVNFTNDMPDANYCVQIAIELNTSFNTNNIGVKDNSTVSAGSVTITTGHESGTFDTNHVFVAIIR